MVQASQLRTQLLDGAYDSTFRCLYPSSSPEDCRQRYAGAVDEFIRLFGDRPATLVSAPGRTEVSGNHTDHQRGIVLAASVNLDIVCVVSPNTENIIRIQSKGYPQDEIDLSDLSPQPGERETAASLIRGVAAWFHQGGYPIGGFDAYTTSDVLGGSGLSSSAAFEVAVGRMLCTLYPSGITPAQIAMAGKLAENEYFGKPSGLMDQMACSVGSFIQIDFSNPAQPAVKPIPFRLVESGLHLCIVDTKGSHADLTGDYAAIPQEMEKVSAFFGKQYLREVNPEDFFSKLAEVQKSAGDRAVLRAIHFFQENALVPQVSAALETGDIPTFLRLLIRSGNSSFTCLQNVFSPAHVQQQGLSLGLALSETILYGRGGAWRVHGGGFAGTIQAFVPTGLLEEYRSKTDALFGEGSCHILSVRPVGSVEVTPELAQEVQANG